ncbi:location of vulva defective 1-like [Ylistrum balloti]|uniref:location of vulva defective 1-like n=1 Tax=Ylistrum balloti TaxID=509963 RepID=UPI002905E27A|nr:location of vulva defective 1-like [Ylistrum balloti]
MMIRVFRIKLRGLKRQFLVYVGRCLRISIQNVGTKIKMKLSKIVKVVSPNGQFFVGFLGFANLQNFNYNGECCDGRMTETGCLDFCDLVFEVSVKGIDSDPSSGKRPSEVPIDNDNAILFPTSYEGVINPMTFDFGKWTGHVNITVDVYDIDENDAETAAPELVDKFHFSFSHDGPSLDFIYMEQTGQRSKNPSKLRMVFRYGCDPYYYGQNCSIDCLVYPNNEECPDTPFNPGHTGVTDWMLLSTTTPRGTTNKQCGFTRKPQSTGNGNDNGSQSELCENDTTPFTDRTTVEANGGSTTQRIGTTTNGSLSTPDNITISTSPPSVTTKSTDSLGTQSMSSVTNNAIIHHFKTTASSAPNNVNESLSAITTGTSNIHDSSTSNSLHTTSTSMPNISLTSTLVQNIDSSTRENIEISTKQPTYTMHEVDSGTGSHIHVLNSSSTTTATKENELNLGGSTQVSIQSSTGSPSNIQRSTGSSVNIQSSTGNQINIQSSIGSQISTSPKNVENSNGSSTNILSGSTLSTNKDGADIRHVTPSIDYKITTETTTDAGLNPTVSKDAMDYWPAIVGGVLGALVLVAIVTFIFYYRKQKALLKRQDIYNVNPKRWALQPPLENGTTEKSEVALETEQV